MLIARWQTCHGVRTSIKVRIFDDGPAHLPEAPALVSPPAARGRKWTGSGTVTVSRRAPTPCRLAGCNHAPHAGHVMAPCSASPARDAAQLLQEVASLEQATHD
jgi:hypothetical protein